MRVRSLLGRTLRLAVPLYLSTLLLGLIPTAVAMIGLGALAGDRPWRGDLLGPGWMNLLVEMLMEAIYSKGGPGISSIVIASVLVFPLVMLAQVVVYSFLAGGILEALGPDPDRPRSFWTACRAWFWPSLGITLSGGAIFVVLSIVLGAALGWLGRYIGG